MCTTSDNQKKFGITINLARRLFKQIKARKNIRHITNIFKERIPSFKAIYSLNIHTY